MRVRDAFDVAFARLTREGCRDEYVYKSALVRRIVLGRHSLRTASVLSEFRVEGCKADIAILNGTSTAYEIKSERDSLFRLDRQVGAYGNVFARVYVVTAESHLSAVLNAIPRETGVMTVNKRFQISTVREASDRVDQVSPVSIFDSIRTEEARRILVSLGLPVPNVPNTELSDFLRQEFVKLTPREAHAGMVQVLKRTRAQYQLADLVSELPDSLHTAALIVPVRKSDQKRLVAAVNTCLDEAMTWG